MATVKQQIAIQKVVENGGVISTAMIEAGYSPATAKTPQKLTESKGWQELMEKYLPDNDLFKVHQEGLKAVKVITSHTGPDMEVEDYPTRKQYLELAYKVKGKLGSSDSGSGLNIQDSNVQIVFKRKDE